VLSLEALGDKTGWTRRESQGGRAEIKVESRGSAQRPLIGVPKLAVSYNG